MNKKNGGIVRNFFIFLCFFGGSIAHSDNGGSNLLIQNEISFVKANYIPFLKNISDSKLSCLNIFYPLGVNIAMYGGQLNSEQLVVEKKAVSAMEEICRNTLMTGSPNAKLDDNAYKIGLIEAAIEQKFMSEDVYLFFIHLLARDRWLVDFSGTGLNGKMKSSEGEISQSFRVRDRIASDIDSAIKDAGVSPKYTKILKAKFLKLRALSTKE